MLVGVVVGVCVQMIWCGKMFFVQFDDGMGMIEVMVFNELFEVEWVKIVIDEVLIIEGKVCFDEFFGSNSVMVDKLMILGEVCVCFVCYLLFKMNGNFDVGKLKSLLMFFVLGFVVVCI